MSRPKVLLATDFSSESEFALHHAVAFARDREGTLLVLHVRPIPQASAGEGMLHAGVVSSDPEALRERVEEMARSITEEEGVPAEAMVVDGDPAAEILRVARDEEVDLIAIGTHGRTGVRRVLMGSVAERVLRRAPCPVLTVRAPDEGDADD